MCSSDLSYGCFYLALGVTRYLNSNSGPIEGHKSGTQRFVLEFGFEIFFLCHKVNHLRILFSVKNLLLASYSRDLAGLEVF